MLIDARDLSEGTRLEADVCVVGGGPAGITVATALDGWPGRVVVLESGGLEADDAAQDLARGEVASDADRGRDYFPLQETLLRRLGGQSAVWAGWCRPLDPHDFSRRDWVPHSGWPLTAEDLADHYRVAARLCELADPTLPLRPAGSAVPPLYRPPFTGGDVTTTVWQQSAPTRFGERYRRDLAASRNVEVLLHATVTRLDATAAGDLVTGAQVACLDGPRFEVRARVYVLAAGAVETARLLLASGDDRHGLGDAHGLVGRHFTEHPHVVAGRVHLTPRSAVRRPQVGAVDSGLTGARARLALERPPGRIRCAYAPTAAAQRRDGLLGCAAHLTIGDAAGRQQSAAHAALRSLVAAVRSPGSVREAVRAGDGRQVAADLGGALAGLLRDPRDLAAVLGRGLTKPAALDLYVQAESAPNPDSRVTLTLERDALGVPRVRLTWRLSALDKRSVCRFSQLLARRFSAAGLGRLEPAEWLREDDDDWGPTLRGGHHQLGTTRMGATPRDGVVDRDTRVHGVANLYVAGGAVLPTVGYANPLLTVVALASHTAEVVRRTSRRAV